MTTYYPKTVTCANCGTSSVHQMLGSTNAMGSVDLDLRPPEMQRSTMGAWVKLCPHCGYVAPDLANPVGDMAVVATSEYRDTLADSRFRELARRFLAHALLRAASDPGGAAHMRLCAAWVCDDARQSDRATECRRLAIAAFRETKPFEDTQRGASRGAVFVDVLRRAGEFQEADAECDALLAFQQAQGILRQVLEYQRRLITAQDTAAHTVADATRES